MLGQMKVISFTHFVQGPAAGQYLADMGADVIKIEPLNGAFERSYGAANVFVDGISATYASVNRNVRSVSVDLKAPGAAELVRRLIETADVVLENYRGGVLERLGFGYEAIKKIRPDIIYASASGWGGGGPLSDAPGQDLLVQARCGLISVTGDMVAAPSVPGVPIADVHGAALMAMAICGAYIRKLQTGQGTRVESNLLSAGLDLQGEALSGYFSGALGQEWVQRDGRLASWFLPAPYGVFKMADCHAVISLGGNVDSFADAIDDAELIAIAQDRMGNRDAIMRRLGEVLSNWTYDQLDRAFAPLQMWYARVQTYDDLRDDPQIQHNGSISSIPLSTGRAFTVLNHPVSYDGSLPSLRHFAETPGADTRAVLTGIGLSSAEIDILEAKQVIRCTSGKATNQSESAK
jgi:crotonobetainyl-CoA:carnitine CoA-transferase CaiB-like acyl-CoA transferase